MRKREPSYDDRRRALLGGLHGGILEIGPGRGANLAIYPTDVCWIGIEPDRSRHRALMRAAAGLGRKVEIREGTAEQLDLADASFDAVVSTRVLCSVRDPVRVLEEIVRVLKPGGRFVFLEHVAAPDGTRLRRFQQFIQPLWTAIDGACRPDREIGRAIEGAGFTTVEMERFSATLGLPGLRFPHIAGIATK